MHAIVHGADIQDRDGGAVLMATLFGAPFHSCLSSTRTAATKGRSFRRRRSAQWRRSTLKSSSGPTAPEGSSFYQSAGLLRGLSRGSIAVADWRKTGSVSAERPSHSYGSPQSGSCCESYAFKRDVRGQTLSQPTFRVRWRFSISSTRPGIGSPSAAARRTSMYFRRMESG